MLYRIWLSEPPVSRLGGHTGRDISQAEIVKLGEVKWLAQNPGVSDGWSQALKSRVFAADSSFSTLHLLVSSFTWSLFFFWGDYRCYGKSSQKWFPAKQFHGLLLKCLFGEKEKKKVSAIREMSLRFRGKTWENSLGSGAVHGCFVPVGSA